MRLPAALPVKGILVGVLTGAIVATALSGPTAPTSDVIVRGTDLTEVLAAVRAHGGTVEVEIGLIDAVGAEVPTALVDDLLADARTTDVTADEPVQLLSLPTETALDDSEVSTLTTTLDATAVKTTDDTVITVTDPDAVTVTDTAAVTVTDTAAVTVTDVQVLETTDVKVLEPIAEPVLEPVTTTIQRVGQLPEAAVRAIGGEVWQRAGLDGSGVDVAVIDSGIDRSAVPQAVAGVDLSLSTTKAHDGFGHGTAMAGVIAGVAPDARIIDVKVADERGLADISQVLAGIDWAVSNRATDGRNIRVLSLSFGTDGNNPAATSPLAYAVEAAWRHGIAVAVAAGNHGDELGRLLTPAVSPWVIAVGAADTRIATTASEATVPEWSAVGDGERNPDLVAPGRSLLGGLAQHSAVALDNPEAVVGDRLLGSGTSQATAFTAGVLAMTFEALPQLTPDAAKTLLERSAASVDAPAAAGHGVLDLERLAQLARRIKRYNISISRIPVQSHPWSDGTGSLDGDRGSFVLENSDGELLTGERTVVGDFDRDAWLGSTWTGSTWTGSTWTGSTWTGSTWTGSTWTGSTWTGSTWTGSTWTGSTWTGSTWTGSTWTNVRWGE